MTGENDPLVRIGKYRLLSDGQTFPILNFYVTRRDDLPDLIPFFFLLVIDMGDIGMDDHLPLRGHHISREDDDHTLIIGFQFLGDNVQGLVRTFALAVLSQERFLRSAPTASQRRQDKQKDQEGNDPGRSFH